ncbi:MAG: pyridoxal phosphate-dependent aminotransferase [Armatimonadetes bacterium]|nr:pyridoxal phosphate-dependent aminotransferase [Armatimonadota bacterium]
MKALSQTRTGLPSERFWSAPDGAENAIDLAADYSHFTVPRPVAEAVVHAAETTDLGRDTAGGGRHLRHSICRKLARCNALERPENAVVITSGVSSGLNLAVATLADAGQSVLIPDPGMPILRRVCAMWGIRPVSYPLLRTGEPDYDALPGLVAADTKALVISSPGLPTGAVLSRTQVRRLVEFAVAHDLYVVSDESCDLLRYDGAPAVGPASFDPDGRVVSIYSFAKTHAMAGLRLGYLVAEPALAEAIGHTQEALQTGPGTLAIAAGLAALNMDPMVVESMRDFYRQQRDSALAMLSSAVVPDPPEAGFYFLVDISGTRYPDGSSFAAACYDAHGLLLAPGDLFGRVSARTVRVTLAVRERVFGAGLERLVTFLEESAA